MSITTVWNLQAEQVQDSPTFICYISCKILLICIKIMYNLIIINIFNSYINY